MRQRNPIARLFHSLDRKSAWAFPPLLPFVASIASIIAITYVGGYEAYPPKRAALLSASGAVMACFGFMALIRPVIRAGGYVAWVEKNSVIDGGGFEPTPEEQREKIETERDALSVHVIGPALGICGTLLAGFSGLLAG